VESCVKTNIERYIAVDKEGTLAACIDKDLQVEEPN
jgi:hypothetical protein